MKMLDTTPTLYDPKKAEIAAKVMNDNDDWTYVVDHDPSGKGYSRIAAFDEDGVFIAYV